MSIWFSEKLEFLMQGGRRLKGAFDANCKLPGRRKSIVEGSLQTAPEIWSWLGERKQLHLMSGTPPRMTARSFSSTVMRTRIFAFQESRCLKKSAFESNKTTVTGVGNLRI